MELCDENGRVKQLLKHQQEYAVTNCAEREMLVLLRVDSQCMLTLFTTITLASVTLASWI